MDIWTKLQVHAKGCVAYLPVYDWDMSEHVWDMSEHVWDMSEQLTHLLNMVRINNSHSFTHLDSR